MAHRADVVTSRTQSRLSRPCDSHAEEGPEIPAALRRHGPLGQLLPSGWEWWSADDLKELLRDCRRRKHWPEARKLLAVAKAFHARDRRFERTCGFKAAEAAPAHSIAGYAVKARTVKLWGRPEMWSHDPNHAEAAERLAAQVLEAVIGMVAA